MCVFARVWTRSTRAVLLRCMIFNVVNGSLPFHCLVTVAIIQLSVVAQHLDAMVCHVDAHTGCMLPRAVGAVTLAWPPSTASKSDGEWSYSVRDLCP